MANDSILKKLSEVKDKIEDGVEALKDRVEDVVRQFKGKEVTVYPSYGYRDRTDARMWVFPMRVWVHDNRDTPFLENYIEGRAARRMEEDVKRPLTADEKKRLEACLADFIADDKSREGVEFSFADDADGEVFRFESLTNANGVAIQDFKLADEKARKLLDGKSPGDWLVIRAATTDGTGSGEGRLRLLEPEGLSLVSDIDDTIKVSEIPAGKKRVLQNTLLKDFVAADGMLEMYQRFDREKVAGGERFTNVSFHYVSGSPWQLFRPLSKFLIDQTGFPRGTFHMKELGLNLLAPGSLLSLKKFIIGSDLATLDMKIRQITNLMINLPRRKFILVGDAGERDPEVFRALKTLFPDQVLKIYIRDVLSARLDGMERITGAGVPVALDTSAIVDEMKALIQSKAVTANPEHNTL